MEIKNVCPKQDEKVRTAPAPSQGALLVRKRVNDNDAVLLAISWPHSAPFRCFASEAESSRFRKVDETGM